VVRLSDGALLNRYWDNMASPRDEQYAEDLETAGQGPRPCEQMYRELRAAAESGWDFSSRWWIGGKALHFTRTTAIAPVDLNCLMFGLESTIAHFAASLDEAAIEATFSKLAATRAAAIRRHFWHAAEGRFGDLDWSNLTHTPSVNAAMLFPLYVGLATAQQAQATAELVKARLLARGGLLTSTERTSEQWDQPNGWAPLQWIAVMALRRYGHHALARSIATRWVKTVRSSYDASRRVFEKYDVERLRPGGGGEYAVQDGFGWTNGVTLALMRMYSSKSDLQQWPRAVTA
jgi:alpha,alpha-trehalase